MPGNPDEMLPLAIRKSKSNTKNSSEDVNLILLKILRRSWYAEQEEAYEENPGSDPDDQRERPELPHHGKGPGYFQANSTKIHIQV